MSDGQLYLINMETLERLEFQYHQDELAIERQTNHAALAVMARNNPLRHYTGGDTTLRLTLDFYARQADLQDVKDRVNFVMRLAHNRGIGQPPPLVKLVWGELISDRTWVVQNPTPRFSIFDRTRGWLPRQAFVDLTLAAADTDDVTANDF